MKECRIHFTLKNEEGVVLDSTRNEDPFGLIQGRGELVPGLENILLDNF